MKPMNRRVNDVERRYNMSILMIRADISVYIVCNPLITLASGRQESTSADNTDYVKLGM